MAATFVKTVPWDVELPSNRVGFGQTWLPLLSHAATLGDPSTCAPPRAFSASDQPIFTKESITSWFLQRQKFYSLLDIEWFIARAASQPSPAWSAQEQIPDQLSEIKCECAEFEAERSHMTHTCSPSYPISDRPARPKNVWKTSAQSPGLKNGTAYWVHPKRYSRHEWRATNNYLSAMPPFSSS